MSRKAWLGFAKVVVAVLVLATLARYVAGVWHDLASAQSPPRLNWAWLAWAGGAYLTGLLIDGLWFSRVLDAGPVTIGRLAAVRAYLVSHLGKYVPGKAMVVVLRVGMVAPGGVRPATAALATLYETLVMMAAGGLVAAAGFVVSPARVVAVPLGPFGTPVVPLATLAFVLASPLLLLSLPDFFGRAASAFGRRLQAVGPEACPRITYLLLGEGLLWTSLGWMLLGVSQVAVMYGLGWGDVVSTPVLPSVIASVALATVAGFVVPVAPGGLGVREWVLWTSLGAVLDHERAVVASLALRLIWVVAEVIGASVLILWYRTVARPTVPGSGPGSPAGERRETP